VYGSSGTALPQPITVAPTVRANDRKKCELDTATNECKANTTTAVGGMMVAFGTGRNVATEDQASTTVQTVYSVLDNTRYRYRAEASGVPKRLEIHPGKTCSTGDGENCLDVAAPKALGAGVTAAKLLKQTTTEVSGSQQATLGQDPLKATNWGSYNGWYLDLPSTGERLLKPLEFYDNTNILTVWSQVPAKGSNVDATIESCEAGSVDDERQYRTFINIMDGATPSIQLMAVADGTTNIMVRRQVHKGAHAMITTKDKNKDIDTRGEAETLNRMPETTSRPSWRQMQ
jgi:type IV pilus assembly protein PilY1